MDSKGLLFSLFFLVLVSLDLHLTGAEVIQVPNQNGNLGDYLCGTESIISGTILELNPEITHTISRQFCLWQNRENVTVQSSQEGTKAVVHCDGTEYSQSGFGFVEMVSITLRNIRFENCGGIMQDASSFTEANTAPRRAINSNQHAVLFLSRCKDISIENVAFSNYRGYAIYAVNLIGQNLFQGVTVTESYAYQNATRSFDDSDLTYSGSGIFFHFGNDSRLFNTNTYVAIMNATLSNNFNIYPEYFIRELQETIFQNENEDIPPHGAGGLTVYFEQQNRQVMVHVENTLFANNSGSAGAGAKIVTRDTIHNSNITFTRCTFVNNSVYEYSVLFAGGGLELLFLFSYSKLAQVRRTAGNLTTAIRIENSEFRENFGQIGAAMAILTEPQDIASIRMDLKYVQFIDNEATADGDCILVESQNAGTYSEERPKMTLESITVHHRGRKNDLDTTAALSFNNIFVTINGTKENPTIISNGKNGALKLFNTYAFLTGEVQFKDNAALQGGAISMEANSYLLFLEPANILFVENRAIKGGAIYSDIVRGVQCVIEFISPNTSKVALNRTQLETLNFNITFIDNTAERDGQAIYVQPIYSCSWFSESVIQVPTDSVSDVYETLFHFQANQTWVNFEDQISSHPFRPCFCQPNKTPMCSPDLTYTTPISVPPGRSFEIPIIPADRKLYPLQSIVEVQLIEDSDDDSNETVRFQSNNQAHFVKDLNGSTCYPAKLTLRNIENTTAVIKFSIQGVVGQSITATVNLEECPPGFKLNRTLSSGICDCVPLFANNRIECDIEKRRFTKPTGYWIGETRFEEDIPACVVRCPNGYCQRTTPTVNLKFNDQCIGNRTGEMCGQCKPGFSIQFGTTDCHKCSDFWLLTIILYILAGALLVVSLFLLRLTISDGLLASVLFYAQLFSINLGLLVYSNKTRFTTVFISLLNLELGFPICFYEGMSQAAKHGLQFVFPVYLWLIVAFITFLSRYSDTLAKLVGADCSKVFVTLIYFAYTKLQRTATDVFIFADIATDTNNNYIVWFYDGGERYFRGKHLILGLISIFFLLFILTPYVFFMFLSQWCLYNSWVSRHFKPLIDATLAPFKDRWRFWFGLRLLIINFLILISILVTPHSAGAVTYAHLVIITLLLVFQAHIKPYKSKLLHYLDLFFLINYVLFLIGCLFIFDILKPSKEQEKQYVTTVEVIIIGSAFVVFVVTIVCHIVIRVKKFYGERRGSQMSPNQDGKAGDTEMDDMPELNSYHSSNNSDELRSRNVTLTVVDIRRNRDDDDDDGAAQLRESLLGDY